MFAPGCNIQGRPTPNRYEKRGVSTVFASLEGTATLYGVTELAELSSPPRKYKEAHHNAGLWSREIDPPGTPWARVNGATFLAFDTSGTKTEQLTVVEERNGATGVNDLDTLEDYVPTATEFRAPNSPEWQYENRRRFFDSVAEGSGEVPVEFFVGSGSLPGWPGGTSGKLRVTAATFQTTHWTLSLAFDFVHQFAVFSGQWQFAVALIGGDAEPPDPSTEGSIIYRRTTSGSDQGVSFPATLNLQIPLNCSVLFSVQLFNAGSGTGVWVRWPVDYGAGQLDAGARPWLYYPSTDSLPTGNYSELLGLEDTLVAGMLRGIATPGTSRAAVTNSVSGGTAAGSLAPLVVVGRVVEQQLRSRGLVNGNLYRYEFTYRDNTIGEVDFSETTVLLERVATAATDTFVVPMIAPNGKERIRLSLIREDLGPFVPPTPAPNYGSRTLLYWARVLAAGGTISDDSLELADALVDELAAEGLLGHMVYLMPLLGDNLAAALVPLLDTLNAGAPANTAFVDADFDESTGLQGGTGRRLTLPFTPGGVNGNMGGMGIWALDTSNAGTAGGFPATMWNAANTAIFGLEFSGTAPQRLRYYWGSVAGAVPAEYLWTLPAQVHGYGQRASATSRKVYQDGIFRNENTSSDAGSGSTAANWPLMGDSLSGGSRSWHGRAGLVYVTLGGLSDAQAEDAHEVFRDFLMLPTGRVSP